MKLDLNDEIEEEAQAEGCINFVQIYHSISTGNLVEPILTWIMAVAFNLL